MIEQTMTYQVVKESKKRSNLLEQGPYSSMTTMDNRVGEGQGGVAATYYLDNGVSTPLTTRLTQAE